MKCFGTWLFLLPHLSACFRVVKDRFSTNSSKACVELIIIGDFGASGKDQRAVRDSMAEVVDDEDADGILALGDNVYEDGVDSVAMMEREWKDVWLTKSALKRKWYAILGNHDWNMSGQAMKDFTRSPLNGGYWQMPDYNHKVKFGSDVEVFMVDTEIWRKGTRRRSLSKSEPKKWLERELGKSSAAWKIVAGHHPVYSAGTHGGAKEMKKELDPIMRSAGANIYLSGHDHSQQHFGYRNVNYIVSGAGSKLARERSDDFPPESDPKHVQGSLGFAGLRICGKDTATLKFYDQNGKTKYTATLKNENPNGGGGEPSRRRGGEPSRRRGGDEDRRRRRRRRAASLGGKEEEELVEYEEGMDEKSDNPRDKALCAGVKMTSVDLRCSDDGCIVQKGINSAKESCDDYCTANGLVCIGAWTNDFNDCGLDAAVACNSFVTGGSSQVCECS